MSETKWTPGPWGNAGTKDIDPDDGSENIPIRAFRAGRTLVLATVHHLPGTYKAERDATARLVAAAPELYDALQKCVNVTQGCDHLPIGGTNEERAERRRTFRACPLCFREAEETGRAALAKAEGK